MTNKRDEFSKITDLMNRPETAGVVFTYCVRSLLASHEIQLSIIDRMRHFIYQYRTRADVAEGVSTYLAG